MEKLTSKFDIGSDEKVVKEMLDEYYNCPKAIKYLTNLGISDEQIKDNIATIIDFVQDINYCEKCPGLKRCNKTTPLLCTIITYKNGVIDKTISPCKKMLEQVEFQKQFYVRDFDEEWLTHGIKKMDGKDSKGRGSAIMKYINYKEGKSDGWIYLHGSQNSGKTYVAAQICVDIAKSKQGPICFINSSTTLKELYDMSFKEKDKFQKELNRYSSCPVLVLDDFGNGYYNDYIRDGILFHIISERSKKRLFTIFTSSYDYDELLTVLATTKASTLKYSQIIDIIKRNADKEISLGEISIY